MNIFEKRYLRFLLVLAIAACRPASVAATSTPAQVLAIIVPPTPTPTTLPIPTATQTVEQAIQPYTIEGLRVHAFQSGEISKRELLLETGYFTRYKMEYPSDGLTITGILQIPKVGQPPYPVIVMNHGFFSRYDYHSGDGTDRAAEFLNRRGYLTVSSDYRSWGEADTGESLFYSGLAIDVINLINALPTLKEADPQRIGMWGHSMGGGVTLKVLTIDPRIKAAVLYSSVSADFSDIIGRWGPGCFGDVLAGEQTLGCNSSDVLPLELSPDLSAAYFTAATDPVMLAAVSPLNYFDFVDVPVRIFYGTEDGKTSAGTPPEWSQKMYKAFVDAGANADLISYQGEGHSFIGEPWFQFMAQTQLFFDKYVK